MSYVSAQKIDNSKFTFITPQKQCFSFPLDVISLMLENPSSSKALQKLYQTCKYFYSKKQILVLSKAHFVRDASYGYAKPGAKLEIYCEGKKDFADLHNLLWFDNEIQLEYFHGNRLPSFYRCSIKELWLYKTSLYYDDFVLLAAEKHIRILDIGRESEICFSDDSTVNPVDLLPFMPNITELNCLPHQNYTHENFEKLSTIQLHSKLEDFRLSISSESSDFAKTFNRNHLLMFLNNNAKKDESTFIGFTADDDKLQAVFDDVVKQWKAGIRKPNVCVTC
uniref:DUF38 domain-containing protein n=1 Tax=Panagrolaimus davidi TaxID=227884 RepID=A0A914Q7C3_9BILA